MSSMYACVYVFVSVYAHMYTYMYICIRMCTCTHVYVYVGIRYTYVLCIHMYICVIMCYIIHTSTYTSRGAYSRHSYTHPSLKNAGSYAYIPTSYIHTYIHTDIHTRAKLPTPMMDRMPSTLQCLIGYRNFGEGLLREGHASWCVSTGATSTPNVIDDMVDGLPISIASKRLAAAATAHARTGYPGERFAIP